MPLEQKLTQPVIVLDTSFLVDLGRLCYWTFEPRLLLSDSHTLVVVPENIASEFCTLTETRLADRLDMVHPDGTPENDSNNFIAYTKQLNMHLSQLLDSIRPEHDGRPGLSEADKLVIQAAYDYSRTHENVSVATGDKTITKALDELWKLIS